MNGKNELQFLVDVVQDFISLQPKSVQIALAEKSQMCVNGIEFALLEGASAISQLAAEKKEIVVSETAEGPVPTAD